MLFLKLEVESEKRVNLARSSFISDPSNGKLMSRQQNQSNSLHRHMKGNMTSRYPTAAAMFSSGTDYIKPAKCASAICTF